jgi:hypothetical protein
MGGDAGGVVGVGQDDAEEANQGTRSGIREGHYLEIRKKYAGSSDKGISKYLFRVTVDTSRFT